MIYFKLPLASSTWHPKLQKKKGFLIFPKKVLLPFSTKLTDISGRSKQRQVHLKGLSISKNSVLSNVPPVNYPSSLLTFILNGRQSPGRQRRAQHPLYSLHLKIVLLPIFNPLMSAG